MREFKISISNIINNNMTKSVANKVSGENWKPVNVEWNKVTLDELVRENAYSFSIYNDGKRLKREVDSVHGVAFDFDKDVTVDKFIEEYKNSDFSWFLHTTVSHTDSINKFRVLIPYEEEVSLYNNGKVVEYIKRNFPLINKMDKTAFEESRYFFLSEKAETFIRNKFDEDGIPVFFDHSKVTKDKRGRPSKNEKKGKEKTGKGGVNEEAFNEPGKLEKGVKYRDPDDFEIFSCEDFVRLSDGTTWVKIKDITQKTPVFSLFSIHNAKERTNYTSANAFVDINQHGQYYMYSSSESKTYWQDPTEIMDETKMSVFFDAHAGYPTTVTISENKVMKIHYLKNEWDRKNYAKQNNMWNQVWEYLPRVEPIFDPGKREGLDINKGIFNLFVSTDFLNKTYPVDETLDITQAAEELERNCEYIYKILFNILGDNEYINYLMNWLATLAQKRIKLNTAWLITSERQGIGKNLFIEQIITPIFGENQVNTYDGDAIASKFNAQDVSTWIRVYDEVFQRGDYAENKKRQNKLKNLIGTPKMTVEPKGVDKMVCSNFMHMFLFSNINFAITLEENDRRYHVIRNPKAKQLLYEDWFVPGESIEKNIKNELDAFNKVLLTLDYNPVLADTPLDNMARRELIDLSLEESSRFMKALKSRDIDYFDTDFMGLKYGSNSDGDDEAAYVEYMIKEFGVIPATNFTDILKAIFPRHLYLAKLRGHLKEAGLEKISTRSLEGKRRKYWTHKDNDYKDKTTKGEKSPYYKGN